MLNKSSRRARQGGRSEVRTSEGVAAHARSRYGWLAASCLGIALLIALLIGLLRPLDEPSLQPAEGFTAPVQRSVTISLPAEPAQITTEELRTELDQITTELRTRFPKVPEALHVVATTYAKLQRSSEGVEVWKECIALAPKQSGPYVGLAIASMDLGDDALAVKTLEQARSVGCTSPEVFQHLSVALAKLGRLEEAAAVSREGVRTNSDSASNYRQLGQVLNQLNEAKQAEEALRKAIELGDQSGNVYFALATACARQGKDEEAARYREEFTRRKVEPERENVRRFQDRYNTAQREIAVNLCWQAAAIYDAQRQPAEAERLYLRALALNPQHVGVAGEFVAFLRRSGRLGDARLVQGRLLEVQPGEIANLINYATLSAQLGELDEAESTLKQAIAQRPDLTVGYAALAQLHYHAGRFDKARWFAETALKQEATSPDEAASACLVLAAACKQLGDFAAAEQAITQAKQLNPGNENLHRLTLESL